jgi:hypothetical protein
MNVNLFLNTNGKGLWSRVATTVRVTELDVSTWEDEGETPDCGELRVKFDLNTWDPRRVGLIYTDRLFESQLKVELQKLGFSIAAIDQVSYSEQGMQGADYVSLDCGPVFITEFRAK